ncbi:flagellar hook-basal body complex protein [Oceanospirillum sp. HFRX-1_2]
MSTFSLGISGLSAAKKHLNTVGNNIANASTVGFKRSRAEFADVYARSGLGSASGQTGNGVRVSNIAQQFSQGGTTFTQNSLDLAIDGNGFFIVEEGNGTVNYTRAGMFGIDKNGYVVSSTGQKLQGYAANANGDDIAVGAIDDIYITQANISPNATSKLDVAFNLDSRAEPPTNYLFDANDSDTYTHLYPSVIYDTLGNSHTMTQYFIKQPPYLPEYGEPTRAVQALLGLARYGSGDYMNVPGAGSNYIDVTSSDAATDDAGGGAFVGDADFDGTLDGDIVNVLDAGTPTSFDPTLFVAAAPATDAERGQNLQQVYNNLENLIDNSSGRANEFYQELYEALTDYLPTAGSGSDITQAVFDGAMTEIEDAISDSELAYSRIDIAAGRMREQLMGAGLGLTGTPDVTTIAGTYTEDELREIVGNMIGELEARRDGNSFTPDTAQGTAWGNGTYYINDAPTNEEAGVYQLALNAIQNVEQDWSDPTAAAETAVKVLAAIESEAAENRWHMHVTVDGEKVTDGNANTPDYFSFNFTEFGQLDEPLPNMFIKDWVPKDALGNQNGSDEPQVFEINLEGTTQFAGSFGATSLAQDGYATGELAGLDIDESGIIIARYTNSQTKLVGQVALANFRNEQGLTPVGGTMWAASTKSGDPVVNSPGVGIAGGIMSKALEDSNVDLSEELVEMIIAQRDYQANAKTLQTADTITQTIINLR